MPVRIGLSRKPYADGTKVNSTVASQEHINGEATNGDNALIDNSDRIFHSSLPRLVNSGPGMLTTSPGLFIVAVRLFPAKLAKIWQDQLTASPKCVYNGTYLRGGTHGTHLRSNHPGKDLRGHPDAALDGDRGYQRSPGLRSPNKIAP